MAMGQSPVPPENIPIPTKIGSKMGGEFTYPKMVPLVLTHSHIKKAVAAEGDKRPVRTMKRVPVGSEWMLG